jgi:hypothetical protein
VSCVNHKLVGGIAVLSQLAFHVMYVVVVVDGLQYIPVLVQLPPQVMVVCLV